MAIAMAFACAAPCSPLAPLRLMLTEFLKGAGGIRFYSGVVSFWRLNFCTLLVRTYLGFDGLYLALFICSP